MLATMSRVENSKSATNPHLVGTPVGVRELRDHLSAYLERVKGGETFTVTEHGRPIAKLVRDDPGRARLLELAAQGRVTLPTGPRVPWADIPHVRYDGSIQDLMDEIRGE
jgi:antitoxin (DNA-binding transcriptional repressor) of toxin-antitoxin stability system